jgi:hypothetical protein
MQGTIIYPGAETPIAIFSRTNRPLHQRESDRAGFDLLEKLNRQHAATRRMTPASKPHQELRTRREDAARRAGGSRHLKGTDAMKTMYGIQEHRKVWPTEINAEEEADYMGRKCLAARRLLERGVRFVQIWSGNDNGFPRRNWDSHEDVERDHGPLAWGMAKAVSALILDLKQRGLLDETIILWTTEFGRMPSTQGRQGARPQSLCLHQLALRRRHQRRRHRRRERSVGLQAARPRQSDDGATTSTPRSCTCSASITKAHRPRTTASTAASPMCMGM